MLVTCISWSYFPQRDHLPENETPTRRKVEGSWPCLPQTISFPFPEWRDRRKETEIQTEDWWRARSSVTRTRNEKQTSLFLTLWWEERWKEEIRKDQGLEKKRKLEQFNPDKIWNVQVIYLLCTIFCFFFSYPNTTPPTQLPLFPQGPLNHWYYVSILFFK